MKLSNQSVKSKRQVKNLPEQSWQLSWAPGTGDFFRSSNYLLFWMATYNYVKNFVWFSLVQQYAYGKSNAEQEA